VARRVDRHGAGVRVVHLLRRFDRKPACGAAAKSIVPTRRPVTCAARKRTRAALRAPTQEVP
jgi:hypothetical protein